MSGVLEGGWEYVTGAYAATAVILASYVLSVFLRYRAERAKRAREAGRAPEVFR